MQVLNVGEKIVAYLDGSVTVQPTFVTNYGEIDFTTELFKGTNSFQGSLNNTTEIDIVTAPDGSTLKRKDVSNIKLFYSDLVTRKLTIAKKVSGINYPIFQGNISQNNLLTYQNGQWQVLNNGVLITSSGVTVHGDLTGLNNDDHLVYLPVSGSRSMAGTLNMNSNPITNATTVNGITIQSHASRHQPNSGTDALTCAAPNANLSGTSTNQEGTANTFARSDHSHAINSATTVVAGLLSASDKSKIDIVDSYNTTATSSGTLVLTATSNQYQLFTGTLNHAVIMPVASTLVQGRTFEIVNRSTNIITVNSSGGNLIVSLRQGSSAKIVCILTSGTTATSWEVIGSNTYYEISSTTTNSTTSATNVLLTNSISGTPEKGTHLIMFSCTIGGNNNTAASTYISLFKGPSGTTIQVPETERRISNGSGGQGSTIYGTVSFQTIQYFNGTDIYEIRWRRTAGTSNIYQRTFTMMRID